jgi:hypothetical protein
MQRLWDSDSGLVVAGNFLYLPLVFDPAVVRELECQRPVPLADASPEPSPPVIEARGSLYVKTVRLDALLEEYAALQPEACENLKHTLLKAAGAAELPEPGLLDANIAVILFQVMPHFLRRSGTRAREELDREKILAWLSRKVKLPGAYAGRTAEPGNAHRLKEALACLEEQAFKPGPAPAGWLAAGELRQWFFQALTGKIAAREKARLAEAARRQEQWTELYQRHGVLLDYLAEQGSLELDGFGFTRLRKRNEYRIYKRTGTYALKDFYGRPYIFPDCRVAVSTQGRLKPIVIEPYKHPLLRRHAAGQEICLPKDFKPALVFSAAAAIQALEAGLNALYYGYNARRRNGYHSLDRHRQQSVLDFDDYRRPPDDPRIVCGEVEVKNYFT